MIFPGSCSAHSVNTGNFTTNVTIRDINRSILNIFRKLRHGTLLEGLADIMILKKVTSVADILEREVQPTIKEWLRRVNLVPELTSIPLSDADRTDHLPKLFQDLIYRLRLGYAAHRPVSQAAAAHGEIRYSQGYSAATLVEESRILQVATFNTLHLHHSELNQDRMLLDIMVIADEADAQLTETVRSLTGMKLAKGAA
jgi:hypothetical protein